MAFSQQLADEVARGVTIVQVDEYRSWQVCPRFVESLGLARGFHDLEAGRTKHRTQGCARIEISPDPEDSATVRLSHPPPLSSTLAPTERLSTARLLRRVCASTPAVRENGFPTGASSRGRRLRSISRDAGHGSGHCWGLPVGPVGAGGLRSPSHVPSTRSARRLRTRPRHVFEIFGQRRSQSLQGGQQLSELGLDTLEVRNELLDQDGLLSLQKRTVLVAGLESCDQRRRSPSVRRGRENGRYVAEIRILAHDWTCSRKGSSKSTAPGRVSATEPPVDVAR